MRNSGGAGGGATWSLAWLGLDDAFTNSFVLIPIYLYVQRLGRGCVALSVRVWGNSLDRA